MSVRSKYLSYRNCTEVTPPHDPCKALAVAVLERAIRDILCPSTECKQFEKREAICWLFDAPDWSARGFTFEGICSDLGLPMQKIRDRVRAAMEGEVDIQLEGLKACRENMRSPNGLGGKWAKRNRY